jgi:predicted protein tyrosine phosphatase
MLTAKNIGLHDAQQITSLDDSEVLISIGNHYGTEHVSIAGQEEKIFHAVFDDCTAKCQNANGEVFTPISSETSFELVKFIEKWKDKNFIIHCHAGISRSAAVCMFIHLIYGHALKENFWVVSHPNPYVLGMLISMRGFWIHHMSLFKT